MKTKIRTMEELAKLSGVIVKRCDSSWGGTFAYHTIDSPTVSICGYKTESALYKDWFNDKFGASAKWILKLMKNQK